MALVDARPLPRTLARRRLNTRALIGAALALVGVVVLGVVYRSQLPHQVFVLRAVHDVPAGNILAASDLQPVSEALPDDVAATFVPASEQADLVGRRASESIAAGEFLRPTQLGRSVRGIAAGQRLVTIPASFDLVSGLAITPGDQVEVVVNNKSRPDTTTARVVVPQATVYEVGPHDASSGPLASQSTSLGSARSTWLAIVVDDAQFQALAQAQAVGDLSVALLSSEATP